MARQNKWVFVLLIYADFFDENLRQTPKFNLPFAKELDRFLESLLQTKYSASNIDIFIIYGSLTYRKKPDDSENSTLTSSSYLFKLEPCENENRIIFIKPLDSDTKTARDESQTGTFYQHRSDTLAQVFGDIKKMYSDEDVSFFLNTWDHGSVFGVFKIDDRVRVIRDILFPDEAELPNITKFMKTVPARILPLGTRAERKKIKEQKPLQILYKNKVYPLNIGEQNYTHIDQVETDLNTYFSFQQEEAGLKIQLTPNSIQKFKDTQSPLLELFKSSNDTNESAFNEQQDSSVTIRRRSFIEILTNEELAEAIRVGFSKVEILMMMNCWMMNLHTIYAVRECASYLVAPQGGISEPGYDNKAILEFINKGKQTTLQIVNKCISSCYDFKNNPLRGNKKIEISSWVILGASVFDKKEMIEKKLIDLIEEIATLLLKEIGTGTNNQQQNSDEVIRKKNYIQLMVKIGYNFSFGENYYQYDFLNWLRILDSFNTVPERNKILRELTRQDFLPLEEVSENLFIFPKKRPSNPYKFQTLHVISPFSGISIHQPNGLSLYIPYVNNDNTIGDKLYKPENGVNKLSNEIPLWNKFLHKLNS